MTLSSHDAATDEVELERGLSGRHVQMIALGGAIGVGLFLGSGTAIHRAGPGLVISYIMGGALVFFVMRALGEMLVHRPVTGGFATYAADYVGPFAGYLCAWLYWTNWIVAGMAELTATGLYVQYWLPAVPIWCTAIAALALLLVCNLAAVRWFGETEFWFAMVKVLAIVGMIVAGVVIILFGVTDLGATASVGNLWSHGGALPHGLWAIILALQFVIFAFFGVELVGVAAAETRSPETTVPRAINSVAIRIGLFYVGSLVVLMSLVAWDAFVPGQSPFVAVFDGMGLQGAGMIVNAVVLTAAVSAGNSALYCTGRMLFALSKAGHAPRALARGATTNPRRAVVVSAGFMLLGVALNAIAPGRAFAYIVSAAALAGICVWGLIVYTHLRFRQAVAAGQLTAVSFRMPGAPWSNRLVLAAMVAMIPLFALESGTRVALCLVPAWILALSLAYRVRVRRDGERGRPRHGGAPAMVAELARAPAE